MSKKKPAVPRNYPIGFGKPPRGKPFQKGQSGNPNGRKKGSENTATITKRRMDERVRMHEGDKVTEMSAREALLVSTRARAIQKGGSDRDVMLRLDAEANAKLERVANAALAANDAEILAAYRVRLLREMQDEIADALAAAPIQPGAEEPK